MYCNTGLLYVLLCVYVRILRIMVCLVISLCSCIDFIYLVCVFDALIGVFDTFYLYIVRKYINYFYM